MSDLRNFRFTATHEWLEMAPPTARVGITDHAQSQLGDVIFLELPEVGRQLSAGEKFGVIESVKAASDLFSPVAGKVTRVNTELAASPERVNQDPYGEGWMIELATTETEGAQLLDESQYATLTHS